MQPNILFVITDQQRHDTVGALGNSRVSTPNLDRLVARGVAFERAYSTCPVCMPARYTLRTGREPFRTRYFCNSRVAARPDQASSLTERCGEYLATTMRRRGYRTFGIGKFHTAPWDEDLGYETHLHSEELFADAEQRRRDAYASWLQTNYPQLADIEDVHGERSEMYYMPQRSPLPARCTVEGWAAAMAAQQIGIHDGRPFFGVVSFIGPHPPFAPPEPFDRMYDPDSMTDPVVGCRFVDHLDAYIPWMNHATFAEDVDPVRCRVLRARYYGEISYVDACLGHILDAVEARIDADRTVICFVSDHGEMLGDHHAWQKECFFEASVHVPFLLSWPDRLPRGERRQELVCLTDLFGIATAASGACESRDGIDIFEMLEGRAPPRRAILAVHGHPESAAAFKCMVLEWPWKYIFMSNGGVELLFQLDTDPDELHDLLSTHHDVAARLRNQAVTMLRDAGEVAVLGPNGLAVQPYRSYPQRRIYQFDRSRGATAFPARPLETAGLAQTVVCANADGVR